MKANLGAGRDLRDGWVNVDRDGPVACDLDRRGHWRFDFGPVDTWLLSHVIEHIHHPLPLFEAMWHASSPDATAIVRCPYGSSDDAWTDPTHVRPWFTSSWLYLSAPAYWRVSEPYGGYTGDWHAETVFLRLAEGVDPEDQWTADRVEQARNVVDEMIVLLHAVKPAREPLAELQRHPEIVFIANDREPAFLGDL